MSDLAKTLHRLQSGVGSSISERAAQILQWSGLIGWPVVQKRSGARSAESVHREIADFKAIFLFFDEDQLGILTSHVNDGPDLWIKILDGLACAIIS